MSEVAAISSTKAPCLREDALAVLLRLREAGHVAYFAGGCVRDLLMGKTPKDWDVATDAPPTRVRELFSHTQAVGHLFGVILVRHRKSTVEVATFRAEGTYSDGRRPDAVTFTHAAEDAQRRDFTINGLFLDPEESRQRAVGRRQKENEIQTAYGMVLDYVGGVADLEGRVLRAIGDADRRFAEDHLRLLRAVRFAARFELIVESNTAEAIRRHAPKLKGISPERIADELRLMLTPTTRGRAWRLLGEYGLLSVIYRFLKGDSPAAARAPLFDSVAAGEAITFGLALAAGGVEYRLNSSYLLALTSRPEVQALGRAYRESLKISNEELDAMVGILEPIPTLLGDEEPGVAAIKRFLARPTACDTRLLLRALAALGFSADRINALERRFEELKDIDVAPLPLINGDHLLTAGFAAGPAFKRILDRVYDAQLEGKITSHEEGMTLAKTLKDGR